MKIELTDLLQKLEPGPIVLAIGGEDYPLQDLTIDQVKKLGAFSAMTESEGLEFLMSIFARCVPPVVGELRGSNAAGDAEPFGKRQHLVKQVAFIIAAIVAACEDVMSGRGLVTAVDEVRDRVRVASAGVFEESADS